jgi:glucosamine--fructose-6-phosphate aminotransferase (isomerizing)
VTLPGGLDDLQDHRIAEAAAGWDLAHGDVLTTGAALDAAHLSFELHWATAEARLAEAPPTDVTFVGCGSALSVACVAAPFFQGWARIPARAVPASELLFHPERVLSTTERPLLVAISRSGKTTETVLAARRFERSHPGRVIVLTCSSGEALSTSSTLAFEAVGAADRALPQTRSYAAMLYLALVLSAELASAPSVRRDLRSCRAVLERSLELNADAWLQLGASSSWSSVLYLGSGALRGLAQEGAIKTIEMALTPAGAMSFLEVRHGPNAIVADGTLVVGLVSPASADAERHVLRELQRQGATVAALHPCEVEMDGVGRGLELPDTVAEHLLPFAYLPALQSLALGRALAVGADPNAPPFVRHYVELDDLGAAG